MAIDDDVMGVMGQPGFGSSPVQGALGGMLSAGMGALSGNPLAIATGALGLGLSLFGGEKSTEAAKAKAAAEQNIAGLEIQQDAVRRKAMQFDAHRKQIEVLRNAQRARSLALNNATSQGAQYGSGLQGGLGQIAGAANWNIAGITGGQNFGEQMFDINNLVNQQKMNIAASSSAAATGQGLSTLGKSLMSSFGPIKSLSGFATSTDSNNSGAFS